MQPPQIDYAPALPGQKRRGFVRRIAFAIAAAVLIIVTIKSAPSAWHRVQILYWQHEAMTYSPPADRVVYDDQLEAGKPHQPGPALLTAKDGVVFDFPKPWDRFYQLLSPPGRKPAATVFLHGLRNSKGEQRLVAIELRPLNVVVDSASVSLGRFEQAVFAPGSVTRAPQQQLNLLHDPYGTIVLPYHHRTMWYAGQADPHDPSHFTVHGTQDGTPVTVNGWLRDNDYVEFEMGN